MTSVPNVRFHNLGGSGYAVCESYPQNEPPSYSVVRMQRAGAIATPVVVIPVNAGDDRFRRNLVWLIGEMIEHAVYGSPGSEKIKISAQLVATLVEEHDRLHDADDGQAFLDECVHSGHSHEASEINNQGTLKQARYVIDNSHPDEVWDELLELGIVS